MEPTKSFIVVYPDLSYTLFDTAKEALLQEGASFIAQYFIKGFFQTFWQSRQKYGYRIVNNSNELYTLDCGGWKVDTSSIEHYFYYSQKLEFNIADPTGKKRTETIHTQIAPEAIIEVLKRINDFSTFDSWSHYDLHLENLQLKHDIKALKEQHENLYSI